VTMVAAHPSGLYNTREAALLVGVQPPTIRDWRRKKYLVPQGLDERDYPLHSAEAIRAAAETARVKGIEASGIDPRQLRGRAAA
jgi:DNA-binding transcriptional MerR regulator